jgi:3-isopropylmalate dehydratase
LSTKGEGGGAAAGMPTFINLKGKLAPLDIQNLDTDMIIPKEYLKTIKRTGTNPGPHCGFC